MRRSPSAVTSPRTCRVCGEQFDQPYAEQHGNICRPCHSAYQRRYYNPTPEKCERCGRSFLALAAHMQRCNGGQREAQCDQCGQWFVRLSRHTPHCNGEPYPAWKWKKRHPPGPRPTNDRDYRAYKRYLATHHIDCWYGCGRRATSPDHRPRLGEHEHIRDTGCCELLPACLECNVSDGVKFGNRRDPVSERW